LDQEEETREGSAYDEGEIVIFPGFTDNKPTIIHQKEKPETNLSTLAKQPEVETVRRQIQPELNGIAVERIKDIDLEANRHMEFNIKLIEAATRSIRSKSRPIPHGLKE